MFGNSCPSNVWEEVKSVLQISQEAFETKYLGLPTPAGRMNKERLQSLQDKLGKRLIEYDDNFMPQSAREILIKAVAQALLVYVMDVFKLSFGLRDKLTKMIRNVYWGAEKGQRKTHWVAWDKQLRPKDHGRIGLGSASF
jgi:hypothetical protein